MRKLLITLPDHDIETYYLSSWSKPIIDEAQKRNIHIFDLRREKANKKTFLSFLKSNEPKFLILNGHSDMKTIYGHNDEPIISEGIDEKHLKDKIIYTVACEAAKSLGESIVRTGRNCFIGYKEKFMFYIDERSKTTDPLSDKIASSFFNPTNRIPISIIKSNTTKESIERSKEEFKKEIIKWKTSKELEAPYILNALLWDLTFLVHLGEISRF